MKTFNKLISFAIISMTSLTYTACSDGFFDRYPTDSMQMETYLKNDAELQNILLNGYYHLQDITLNVNYVNSVSIRPRACFFPLFSFLPLWLHYNLNPLCVQY